MTLNEPKKALVPGAFPQIEKNEAGRNQVDPDSAGDDSGCIGRTAHRQGFAALFTGSGVLLLPARLSRLNPVNRFNLPKIRKLPAIRKVLKTLKVPGPVRAFLSLRVNPQSRRIRLPHHRYPPSLPNPLPSRCQVLPQCQGSSIPLLLPGRYQPRSSKNRLPSGRQPSSVQRSRRFPSNRPSEKHPYRSRSHLRRRNVRIQLKGRERSYSCLMMRATI